MPELLAPAGNLEKLATALRYGANAVYLGGPGLNLRATAAHLSWDGVAQGIDLAHQQTAKAYVTLNALPRQRDLPLLRDIVARLADLQPAPDALIVADPGVFDLVREQLPDVPIHVSTQAGTLNSAAARAWAKRGAARVNLGRELDLRDIRGIVQDAPGLELEAFVRGAQCMAIAGTCLMSAWLTERSGNLGTCSHPCRYDYRPLPGSTMVEEALRPDQPCWEVEASAADFGRMFAPQDLGLIKFLPWFCRLGVHGLKIECRMKSTLYVAQVTDVYATALADFAAGTYRPQLYLAELARAATRPFGSGFFLPGGTSRRRTYVQGRDEIIAPVAAKILEPLGHGAWAIEARGKFSVTDGLELMMPGLQRPPLPAGAFALETDAGLAVETLHPGQRGVMKTEAELEEGIFVRKK